MVNVAAREAARKREKPHLYCRDCLWMTGGGQCPRHGGPRWSAARQAEANRISRSS